MRWWAPALLLLVSTSPVLASFSFQIASADPLVVTAIDQEITVNLSLSDLPSPSYFRVAFQKSTGDPYFGLIKNDQGEWVSIQSLSADCRSYFFVSDASASAVTLLLKAGNDFSPESGQYQIRAHRFTSSACSSTPATNSLTLDFAFPSPPPTLTPTPLPPTSTSVPTLTPTPKPPTSTPTTNPTSTPKPNPTATKTPTPSPKPSVTPIPPTLILTPTPLYIVNEVLGLGTTVDPQLLPTAFPSPTSASSSVTPSVPSAWLPYLFIGFGLIFFAASLAVYLRSR